MTTPDAPALEDQEREVDRAFSGGNLQSAATLLSRIIDRRPDHIDSWLKLAAIRRAMGDTNAASDAIGKALQIDPLHFVALLSRARLLESLDQKQEAARVYAHALAQLPEDASSPQLQAMITHARSVTEAYQKEVEATWDEAIAAQTLSEEERKKVRRFKTNALRKTQVYHSEPTHYHYPGLPEFEFHPRELFPWLRELEAATPIIQQELDALLGSDRHRAEPYIQYAADLPIRQWADLNHSADWTALHLVHGGKRIAENADRCPHTLATLQRIGQPRVLGRSPNAMFSLLKPRTRIPPHTGISNTRLVCHLPLIVPDGCWFRVGAETREWKVGEAFVFDDTMEHEAANDSDEPRIVLIFDIWHHALSETERKAVVATMEAEEVAHGLAL